MAMLETYLLVSFTFVLGVTASSAQGLYRFTQHWHFGDFFRTVFGKRVVDFLLVLIERNADAV